MNSTDILNDTFIVKFDEELQSVLIVHPDENVMSGPVVQIKAETLEAMDFQEASLFLGEKVMALIPQIREQYKDDLAKLAGNEPLD